MITCNFCGIDQPNRALAAHQTTSASCLTIQLKTALARTDAAEKERDDARGALAVETRNANRLAHDRDASRAEVERLKSALSWYAEPKNVEPDFHEPEWAGGSVAKWRPIDEDCGERARAVLAAEVKP